MIMSLFYFILFSEIGIVKAQEKIRKRFRLLKYSAQVSGDSVEYLGCHLADKQFTTTCIDKTRQNI